MFRKHKFFDLYLPGLAYLRRIRENLNGLSVNNAFSMEEFYFKTITIFF